MRSLNNEILRQLGEEYGADGIELSAHALCAEDHLPYQGRQFSNEEFERLQGSLARPFGQWNCRHTMFPIILGVSKPVHTPEELAAYARNSRESIEIGGREKTRYEWTQEQRKIETAVRQQRDIVRLAKAAGDDVLRREAQANITGLQDRYLRISRGAGLDEKSKRMAVAGFRAVKTAEPNIHIAVKDSLQGSAPDVIINKADTSTRFERTSGVLDKPYRELLDQRFAFGDPTIQKVYDKFIPSGGAVYDGSYIGTAHYSPGSNAISMNFSYDAGNIRGAGTTWFHEHGHYIDANAGNVSQNLKFSQAIVRDCREYEKTFRKTYKLHNIDDVRRGISYELCHQGNVTHSIQDIFGAYVGKPYPGAQWGHKSGYWKNKGATGICSETFAHMFEASFDPNKRALMQNYFPNAWAEFEKMIGGIV